ncbi:Uncharacterised protein [Neisseria meningitidis]|nr:Uncharacterised protein [Neisseria meningitidis]CWR83620.1 Uncharacterised protein [Neisseria meningitidis]
MDLAVGFDFKGFVVRAVFFRRLRHQSDVGHSTHGCRVKCAVFAAEVDGCLVNAGVAAVGNHGFGVLRFAVFIPHTAGVTNHRRHRSINDDIAGNVQVGNAFIGIDHRQIGVGGVNGGDFGFDGGAGVRIQFVQIGKQVAEAVVNVDAGSSQFVAEFFKNRREEYFDGVSEDNRVGHFHHSGFHVQREQHAFCFRIFYLFGKEGEQGFFTHHGRVDDFAGFQGNRRAQLFFIALFVGEHDGYGSRFRYGNGLFVMEKVAALHGGNVGFGVFCPCAHAVRIFFGKVFHRFGGATVGVAFTQDRVYRAAFDAVVAFAHGFFFIGLRVGRIIGNGKAFRLQFFNRGGQLRYGCADVRQFDYVCIGLFYQFAQFGKRVGYALRFGQIFGECRQNTAGQGNVGSFDINIGVAGKSLHNRQQRLGRQRGGFVGMGINNGGFLSHRIILL